MGPPTSHFAVAPPCNEDVEVSKSYVLMVQHLIERCLLLRLSREDCVRAISKHAKVKPAITLTVWKELEAENPDFFATYAKRRVERKLSALMGDTNGKFRAQRISEGTSFPRSMQKVFFQETRASEVRSHGAVVC